MSPNSLRKKKYKPNKDFTAKANIKKEDLNSLNSSYVKNPHDYWEKLDNGVFTACEICFNKEQNKYDEPLIQLRAKKIIHDKKSFEVKYYNTYLTYLTLFNKGFHYE